VSSPEGPGFMLLTSIRQGDSPRSRITQRIWPASRCGPQSHRGRAGEEEANQAVLRSSASRSIIRRPLQRGFARRVTLARVPALMPWSTTAHLVSCGRFDTCRRSTLSCWRSTRISATSFVLGGLCCRPTHVCAENQILQYWCCFPTSEQPKDEIEPKNCEAKTNDAPEAGVVIAAFGRAIEKLRGLRLSRAAELVEMAVEETLAYYAFPEEHWRRIRTNNPLERILREIRRRIS